MKETVKHHTMSTVSNNDRHPVSKTITPIHYTSLHFTTLVENSLLI